jgi:succinoglycan biosynthesis protein ExoA
VISVSVVAPCRNERADIETFVTELLAQDRTGLEVEFLIADGRSDDGTREWLEEKAHACPELRLVDNPGGIVPTGLNAAIGQARGEIIIRMDAHTNYAPDYIQECVRILQHSGADNVGGPWQARGRTYLQKAIALAFQSPFSSGGAASHSLTREGEVDSVYLGCWRRATLLRLGGFDEDLVRNQDDELNLRLIRAGGKLWQSPSIRSWYSPRGSIAALFRQYLQYGYWKVRVIQKHRRPASVRHLVPSLFMALLLVLLGATPFIPWARWGLIGLVGSYAVLNLVATAASLGHWRHLMYLPVLPGIFLAFHWGYGLGFLLGMLDFGVRGRTGRLRGLTR